MKVALISDLHANREALEAVLADVDRRGVQRIVCLGDVVGYGPDPEYCVDRVRERAEICLMGNHDEALLHDASDFNPHAREALEWTRERMRPHWYSSSRKKQRWSWLASLPLTHTEGRFTWVHGSTRDPVREYVLSTDGFLNPSKLSAIFDSFEGIAVGGHTHHPGVHDEDLRFRGMSGEDEWSLELPPGRKAFLNVGSTGQPRDGDNRACYVILEERRATWYRVVYDYRQTMAKIRATGVLNEVLAQRLMLGK